MLLGDGDSSRLDEKQASTLSDLRRLIETGHIIALTKDQADLLTRALDWYEMWENTFRLLGSLRNTALLLGFLLTIWVTTEGTILEAIRGIFR